MRPNLTIRMVLITFVTGCAATRGAGVTLDTAALERVLDQWPNVVIRRSGEAPAPIHR